MTYASFEDVLKQYDMASLATFCGELADYGGAVDEDNILSRVNQALKGASSEMDMYLSRRYKTPLPANEQLKEACIDLAVWRLPISAAEHSESLKEKCNFWRKSLEQVANGKLSIPEADLAGNEILSDGQRNQDLTLIDAGESHFNQHKMKGY